MKDLPKKTKDFTPYVNTPSCVLEIRRDYSSNFTFTPTRTRADSQKRHINNSPKTDGKITYKKTTDDVNFGPQEYTKISKRALDCCNTPRNIKNLYNRNQKIVFEPIFENSHHKRNFIKNNNESIKNDHLTQMLKANIY